MFARIVFLLWLPLLAGAQGRTYRVLFLGNSYTAYNGTGVASIMQQFVSNDGDTLFYDSYAPGGYTLQGHSGDAAALNKIRLGGWDYVVLQEQSQRPSFPPAQVAVEVYPYAARLNDTIEKYNPCGQTVFFMTWGRKNGDAANCPNYTPLCTYEGMQQRLRESYLEMSADNQAVCAPVGAAWRWLRAEYPSIELYVADESHPSYAGSYLAASVFYAALFRRSPQGQPFYGTLPDTVAQRLQQAAAHVVLDSMSNWLIEDYDIRADFGFTVQDDTLVVFDNQSANAQGFVWNFGDGSPEDTSAQPTHIFMADGTYSVQLTAWDSCGRSHTLVREITIQRVINGWAPLPSPGNALLCLPNPSPDGWTLLRLEGAELRTWTLSDAWGRTLQRGSGNRVFLPQRGWFVLNAEDMQGRKYQCRVFKE